MIDLKQRHCFVTLAKGDKLVPNAWMNKSFSGDIFLLELSHKANPDGTWSYRDIFSGPVDECVGLVGLRMIKFFRLWLPDVIARVAGL